MASINYAAREISVKIVYYGPGLSGKTTNLQIIHRKVPPEFKSEMVSLATETDRTLFFDFLPLDLGKIKGFSTKFQLYTVPGQVYYNATRKLVLRGVDGVVFVADSSPDKVQENLESFQNLEENLAEYGYKRENVPIIIQYNKRDLPNALTIDELQQLVNKYNLPWSEAVANKGKGVFDSLKLIGKIVIDYLNKKYSRGTPNRAPEPGFPAQPEIKRPMGQDSYAPRLNQIPGGQQNQYQSFQMPPQNQQSFQQQPRNIPAQPQQSRPLMPPAMQQKPMQQPPMMPQQPGRMLPPQMTPGPKPAQPPQYGMPQQNQAYFQQQQIRPQQQNFNQGQQMQQGFGSATNQNQFIPPSPMPPIQKQQHFPAKNQFELDAFDDTPTFEQQPPMPGPNFSADKQVPQQNDYFDYGAVNLEPMNIQGSQQPLPMPEDEGEIFLEAGQQPQASFVPQQDFNDGNQFRNSGKTDLDMEIEKYQREIEEKQKRVRTQPAQPQQPQKAMPSQGQQLNNPGMQQRGGMQSNQFGANTAGNEYDVYNMEVPTFQPPIQPPQQQQAGSPEEGDDAMFFTSVDPERQKHLAKKPVINPRMLKDQQQQKGFLSKFFNRDTP